MSKRDTSKPINKGSGDSQSGNKTARDANIGKPIYEGSGKFGKGHTIHPVDRPKTKN